MYYFLEKKILICLTIQKHILLQKKVQSESSVTCTSVLSVSFLILFPAGAEVMRSEVIIS
ncbi:hypothetical protein T4C_2532 [Trichinella pseudospiralis]|uniref:Uncharacterized protein n=1 Tax=Trichinella pseudospiralis TaxID=6337 RepID=A0A0V1JPA4_TRIPS|nr:hypothetical protein T4C_2532 [Trichinella pseudospiralis]